MDLNAFSFNNLNNDIFKKELQKFPLGWSTLTNDRSKYCYMMSNTNGSVIDHISTFSCSFMSYDFEFMIEKENGVKEIVKNKAVKRNYTSVAKKHFIEVERSIMCIGVAAWKPIFKGINISHTIVSNDKNGVIYTKYINAANAQYYCFLWNYDQLDALSFNNKKYVKGTHGNSLLGIIDNEMKFHIHSVYAPSSKGDIRTPLSSTFDEYMYLSTLEKTYSEYVRRTTKLNAVITKNDDFVLKTADELLTKTVQYASNPRLFESEYSNIMNSDGNDEDDTCNISPDKKILKDLSEITYNKDSNTLLLPPKTNYKELKTERSDFNLIERRKIFNELLDKVLKHPLSSLNAIKYCSSAQTNKHNIHATNSIKKEENREWSSIYSSFATDLFKTIYSKVLKKICQTDPENIKKYDIDRVEVLFPISSKTSFLDLELIEQLYNKKMVKYSEYKRVIENNVDIKLTHEEPLNDTALLIENINILYEEGKIGTSIFLSEIDKCISEVTNISTMKRYIDWFNKGYIDSKKLVNNLKSSIVNNIDTKNNNDINTNTNTNNDMKIIK